MKKIIAMALALVLCFSLMSVTALAADAAFLTMSSASVADDAENREVTLYVNLNNNPGVAGMQLIISYDDSVLEKVNYAGTGMNGQGYWTIVTNAVWDHNADVVYNGQILALTYKVKEGVEAGTKTNVSVSCVAGNVAGEYVAVGGAAGTVTVTCSHVWGEGEVTKAATCTEDGEMTYTCSKCGETKTEVIAAGHTWEEAWTTDPNKHWHKCAVCGADGEKEDHKFYEVGFEAPTPEKDGALHFQCSVCLRRATQTVPYDHPRVGDIRPMMLLGFCAVLFTLAAGVYVFKRKFNA